MDSVAKVCPAWADFKSYSSLQTLIFFSLFLSPVACVWVRNDVNVQGTLDSVDCDKIEIDANYTGPYIKNGIITPEFMADLVKFYNKSSHNTLHQKFVFMILRQVRDHFKAQPSLIEIKLKPEEKITVCGDIHGQLDDLLHIFDTNGYPSVNESYVFNGDFVDRRTRSVECALIYFGYKLLYPNTFFINRGNHEDQEINKQTNDSLATEVRHKYPENEKLLHGIWEVFQWLPLAYVISNELPGASFLHNTTVGRFINRTSEIGRCVIGRITNYFKLRGAYCPLYGRVFVVHGGLFSQRNVTLEDIKNIKRGCDPVDKSSLMFDMLWSDPGPLDGRHENKLRNTSIQFGPDVSESFCQRNRLDYIIRSHVPLNEGYHVEHYGRVITVFSTWGYARSRAAFAVLTAPVLVPKFTRFEVKKPGPHDPPGTKDVYIDEKNIGLWRYTTMGPESTGISR